MFLKILKIINEKSRMFDFTLTLFSLIIQKDR